MPLYESPAPAEHPSDSDVESLFMPNDADRIRDNGRLELWRSRGVTYQPGEQMRLRLGAIHTGEQR